MRRIVAISPFASMTASEARACAEGFAEVSMPFDWRFTQHHGYLHGGLIGYLADTALSWAAASVVGDVLTSEFRVHLLAPGKGDRFLARGWVIKAGRRQVVARADVFAIEGDRETLVATATGTVVPVVAR
jgi:uncharacterized protein (TIGR00369 family)